MGILALLLTATSVTLCYIDWSNSYAHAREVLEISITRDGGQVGSMRIRNSAEGMDPSFTPPPDASVDSPLPRDPLPMRNVDIAVAAYVLSDGELRALPSSGGLLDDDVVQAAAQTVENAPDGMGEIDELGLVYLKESRGAEMYVAFADDSILDGWQSLALTLLVLELAVLALFFLVSVMFSKWALRPVQEAWKKQREFVSNASHELKTPLSIASANTSILLDEPDMPASERKEWLCRSAGALDRMRSLVDDMLELASIDETGDGSRDAIKSSEGVVEHGQDGSVVRGYADGATSTDLSRVAQGALLQFESIALERGFVLEEEIAPDVEVFASTDDVKRVVDVILDNACKYVDEGGCVKIGVTARDGGFAEFSVSNSGSFIPDSDIALIFDRFYRGDEARCSGEGYGLGLSIASRIMDNVGGKIEVSSTDEPSPLTTFTVSFRTQ